MIRLIPIVILLLIIGLSCKSQEAEQNIVDEIVLVNVGTYNKLGVANELKVIKDLNPKVTAICLNFFSDIENDYLDSVLLNVITQSPKTIIGIDFLDPKQFDDYLKIVRSSTVNVIVGGMDVILDDDENGTLSSFEVSQVYNGQSFYNLAVQIAMNYDSVKTLSFTGSNENLVDVEYIGYEEKFRIFSENDVLGKRLTKEDVEGKIVLLGWLGPYEGFKGQDNYDKFYSPLNSDSLSNSPDMYRVVYFANIINQILRFSKD